MHVTESPEADEARRSKQPDLHGCLSQSTSDRQVRLNRSCISEQAVVAKSLTYEIQMDISEQNSDNMGETYKLEMKCFSIWKLKPQKFNRNYFNKCKILLFDFFIKVLLLSEVTVYGTSCD